MWSRKAGFDQELVLWVLLVLVVYCKVVFSPVSLTLDLILMLHKRCTHQITFSHNVLAESTQEERRRPPASPIKCVFVVPWRIRAAFDLQTLWRIKGWTRLLVVVIPANDEQKKFLPGVGIYILQRVLPQRSLPQIHARSVFDKVLYCVLWITSRRQNLWHYRRRALKLLFTEIVVNIISEPDRSRNRIRSSREWESRRARFQAWDSSDCSQTKCAIKLQHWVDKPINQSRENSSATT